MQLSSIGVFQVQKQSHFRPQSRCSKASFEGGEWAVDVAWDSERHSKAAVLAQQLFPHPSPLVHSKGSHRFQTMQQQHSGWECQAGESHQ